MSKIENISEKVKEKVGVTRYQIDDLYDIFRKMRQLPVDSFFNNPVFISNVRVAPEAILIPDFSIASSEKVNPQYNYNRFRRGRGRRRMGRGRRWGNRENFRNRGRIQREGIKHGVDKSDEMRVRNYWNRESRPETQQKKVTIKKKEDFFQAKEVKKRKEEVVKEKKPAPKKEKIVPKKEEKVEQKIPEKKEPRPEPEKKEKKIFFQDPKKEIEKKPEKIEKKPEKIEKKPIKIEEKPIKKEKEEEKVPVRLEIDFEKEVADDDDEMDDSQIDFFADPRVEVQKLFPGHKLFRSEQLPQKKELRLEEIEKKIALERENEMRRQNEIQEQQRLFQEELRRKDEERRVREAEMKKKMELEREQMRRHQEYLNKQEMIIQRDLQRLNMKKMENQRKEFFERIPVPSQQNRPFFDPQQPQNQPERSKMFHQPQPHPSQPFPHPGGQFMVPQPQQMLQEQHQWMEFERKKREESEKKKEKEKEKSVVVSELEKDLLADDSGFFDDVDEEENVKEIEFEKQFVLQQQRKMGGNVPVPQNPPKKQNFVFREKPHSVLPFSRPQPQPIPQPELQTKQSRPMPLPQQKKLWKGGNEKVINFIQIQGQQKREKKKKMKRERREREMLRKKREMAKANPWESGGKNRGVMSLKQIQMQQGRSKKKKKMPMTNIVRGPGGNPWGNGPSKNEKNTRKINNARGGGESNPWSKIKPMEIIGSIPVEEVKRKQRMRNEQNGRRNVRNVVANNKRGQPPNFSSIVSKNIPRVSGEQPKTVFSKPNPQKKGRGKGKGNENRKNYEGNRNKTENNVGNKRNMFPQKGLTQSEVTGTLPFGLTKTVSEDFKRWYKQQMKSLGKNIKNDYTLMFFLISLKSDKEVEDYVFQILGNSERTRKFVIEFKRYKSFEVEVTPSVPQKKKKKKKKKRRKKYV